MGNVRIIDHSKEVIEALDEKLDLTLDLVGMFVASEAQDELDNSPRRIDTGLLKNSITHAVSGKSPAIGAYTSDDGTKSGSYSGNAPKDKDKAVYVGTNVEYGIYVHEGTSNMSPNRFLRNACERNVDQIKEYFKNNLKS